MRFQRSINLAFASLVAVLTAACGSPNPQAGQVIVLPDATHRTVPQPPARETAVRSTMTDTSATTALAAADAALARQNLIVLVDAAAMIAAAQKVETAAVRAPAPPIPRPAAVVSPIPAVQTGMDVQAVMACIRAHESGNYAEAHNPGGATGAYQYEGTTFRAYEGRWAAATGYAGPMFGVAYEAPPWMQDAVTVYALTNGGAGNWSMRWGNDPCTSGLPGGG